MLGSIACYEPAVKLYGIVNDDNIEHARSIDIDDYDSFDELLSKVEAVACQYNIPMIRIDNDRREMYLGLANPCRDNSTHGDFKVRNQVRISNEKIEDGRNSVSLDSLEVLLSRHYNNHNRSDRYSERPSKTSIHIINKNMPISGLESLLIRIIDSYDNAGLSVPLVVYFDRPLVVLPPPPPLPKMRE